MLVYQENGNVFALVGKGLKGLLDGALLGLFVDDEEVLLRVRGSRCVLSSS